MFIRFSRLTLLILTCGVFSSISAMAQDCGALFKPEKKWSSIALDYAPTLVTSDGPQSFSNSVLIEIEDIAIANSLRQHLFPYIDPVTHLMYPFGKNLLHEVGLKAIYQNYGSRVQSEILNVVRDVESGLTLDRQSTMLINDANRGNGVNAVDGFIRIVDGSIYQSGIRATTRFALPLEVILAKLGKSTRAVRDARDKGFAVFEVGKYFLNSELSGPELTLVRKHMMRWMIQFLETRGEPELSQSVYFAHVASRIHRLAYERGFGFREVSSELSSGLVSDEHLLQITGADFLRVLKTRLQE